MAQQQMISAKKQQGEFKQPLSDCAVFNQQQNFRLNTPTTRTLCRPSLRKLAMSSKKLKNTSTSVYYY